MNQREKFLLAGVLLIVAAWFGWGFFDSYQDGYARRMRELSELDETLFNTGVDARRARQSLRKLEKFQEQSLPADPDVARSVYTAWLIDTIQASGLELGSVKFASVRQNEDASTSLSFTSVASGKPEAVVKLLDAYYRLDVLHQITNLQLRPADDEGDEWNVTFTSVALIVNGAPRETGLPETPRDPARLAKPSAGDYVQSVGGRNLFASYTPPPPPKPAPVEVVKETPKPKPSPPPFDDAEHAALSGIVGYGDAYEAWIVVRTTGVTLRLHDGDALEVGQFKGKVESVSQREMTVVAEDGAKFTVDLGEMIGEAQKASRDAA
ncbi:hypothetical protein [Botrimarina mediterranea]|uniref:Uncharacterized protein n=1 Tax=Botrimarina mediterranea TaxID=2528022 RepID=A0A518K763_9BACT|nr:hypothetical protein [Botrimarina mediterranea]QDV73628.1 hypothetical protein Spa11_18260 [Botrimarina mediterranea]QDV78218.1 hypothetical protein K2D_18240 [Planctomycetes bacterium K2D]